MTRRMIVVVDYGMGNLSSVLNALRKIQVDACVSSSARDVWQAEKLVLPGVGAFDEGIRNLKSFGLAEVLRDKVIQHRTPILGICLGLQLFTRRSDEGACSGLGWLPSDTVAFPRETTSVNLKIPHMGWNTIEVRSRSGLIEGVNAGSTFYFAHSYYVRCDDPKAIVATSTYGGDFPSIVQRGNIFGTQFHPEKSHALGLEILRNFATLC